MTIELQQLPSMRAIEADVLGQCIYMREDVRLPRLPSYFQESALPYPVLLWSLQLLTRSMTIQSSEMPHRHSQV